MRTRLAVGILVAVGCIIVLSGERAIAGCYPDNGNPACEGNFNYDCDVDGSDAALFKSDFGRSPFSNPCPSAGPASVPKTGQTTAYATGDDGDLEKGVAWPIPRFTDHGDGTVTDNLTGLIWLKNANCFGQRSWNNALSDCNGLNTGECGLIDGSVPGDWRLPNLFELESLRDMKYFGPALSNTAGTAQWSNGDPFTDVVWCDTCPDKYLSSTTYVHLPDTVWFVNMSGGGEFADFKSIGNYVWCVRGGQ